MIPPFESSGYLPSGIYETTVDEFKQRFVYGTKRNEIFNGILRLIEDLKAVGCNAMYVDGSYISEKQRPNDADICWEMIDDPIYEAYAKRTCPVLFMTKGKRPEQQARYCSDVFIADAVELSTGLAFLNFFQKIKYSTEPKGIIKIYLI